MDIAPRVLILSTITYKLYPVTVSPKLSSKVKQKFYNYDVITLSQQNTSGCLGRDLETSLCRHTYRLVTYTCINSRYLDVPSSRMLDG